MDSVISYDDEIEVGSELSEEFQSFEEFCAENSGREQAYLDMVSSNPLEMDAVTLAFSLRHMVRLSRGLMDTLLKSLNSDSSPPLKDLLAVKGIQLDKSRSAELRHIVFAFRDSSDEERSSTLVRALQLMSIGRERKRVKLHLGESYQAPGEGWLAEDFGGDDSLLETVRTIEDPHWKETEET